MLRINQAYPYHSVNTPETQKRSGFAAFLYGTRQWLFHLVAATRPAVLSNRQRAQAIETVPTGDTWISKSIYQR